MRQTCNNNRSGNRKLNSRKKTRLKGFQTYKYGLPPYSVFFILVSLGIKFILQKKSHLEVKKRNYKFRATLVRVDDGEEG